MKVFIPGPLLSYTQQNQQVEGSGSSLDELMTDLNAKYPGMRFRVIDEQGGIRRHMKIFVNAQQAADLSVSISESDEIVILQALSGG